MPDPLYLTPFPLAPNEPVPTGHPLSWPGQAWVDLQPHQLWRGPVRKKIAPHQPGAGRWAERFGPHLVCVRYRDDPQGQRRVVTVELLVDERPLKTRPAPPPVAVSHPSSPPEPPAAKVGVRIERQELEARYQAKQAGGRWNPHQGLWVMTRAQAQAAGLAQRIVPLIPLAHDMPQKP